MSQDVLNVWLHGEHIAEVEQLRSGRLRLRYDSEAVNRYGEGSTPLSLSLPLTRRRLDGPQVETFVDGLLPEGQVRDQLARRYRARTAFDLIAHIGEECAGAVQFTRTDAPPGDGRVRPLTGAEVDRLVVALPTLTPPGDEPITASLGGIQAKLLLTRMADGWGWPSGGAMSTHLVKPHAAALGGPEHLVEAEHWALRVAARAGLAAARTELTRFDGRPAIVVERFDREGGVRSHQEDFVQALGLPSRAKYEYATDSSSPSRLRTIAALASTAAESPRRLLETLLAQVTFNAIIGNADAHSKNYSLTIDRNALVSLSPLYDVASVFFLGAYRHSGHAIDGQVDLTYITRRHLIAEGVSWGLRERRAVGIVDQVVDAVGNAVADVAPPPEVDWLPERVAARVAGFARAASPFGD